jgi:signal transduction histidine kinase
MYAACAVVFLGLTIAMALGWKELRGRAGLSRFAAAYGVVIAAAALFAARGWAPDLLVEVVANVLLVAAGALILDGTRRFCGLPGARALVRLAVALAIVGFPWLRYVRPSDLGRTVLANGLVAVLLAVAARTAARHPSRSERLLDVITAASLACCALAFGARAVLKAAGVGAVDPRDGDVTAAIATLAGTLGAVIWTMTVLTSANRRLSLEIARARDEMTHLMVHDLRSPMVSITGALDLLGEAKGLAPRDQGLLQMARRNAVRQSALIDSILDIWQLEEGAFPQRRTSVAVGTLVGDALRLAGPRAQARRLGLEAVVPGDLPEAWVDVGLVERVLGNLVGNAIKFSPEGGGSVIVSAANAGADGIRISVSDSGPGVEAALRPRLFSRFAQGAHTARGSGLGLAFCRLAVEASGGRIWLEDRPGPGAHFLFTLPAAPATATRPAVVEEEAGPGSDAPGLTGPARHDLLTR